PSLKISAFCLCESDSSVLYYIDNGGKLFRSDNRGGTWNIATTRTFGSARRIVASPFEHQRVWIAADTGLWYSPDGGVTWRPGPDGQPPVRTGDHPDVVVD